MDGSVRAKENHSISTDILDDLASRFIINVPDEERSNFVRICFQIELAHWFYLDFYCTGEDSKSLAPCGIKQFANHIFKHIPFLSLHVKKLEGILQEWKQYKMTVPTYGAILMTADLKHVLLVQSYWAKSSWGFPKGKVNEDEDPLHCAIREVFEETGFDITKLAVADEFIEGVLNYQYTRLYLIRNVPIETVFVPRTRKEIKCCEWFSVEHLPTHKTDPVSKTFLGINANSFFMIMPFVKRLKKWINEKNNALSSNNIDSAIKKYNNIANKSAAGKIGCTSNGSQTGVNSSGKICFFKNNSRQRHKSLGDIETPIPNSSTPTMVQDVQISDLFSPMQSHNELATNYQLNQVNHKLLDAKISGECSQTNGKRRLFTVANPDESKNAISLLDMQQSKTVFQPKILTRDNKKKTDRSVDVEYLQGVNGIKKIQKKVSKSETILDPMQYKIKNQQRLSSGWLAVFNPPQLSQLLRDEPNIINWRNIKLNKDKIYNESLKMLL